MTRLVEIIVGISALAGIGTFLGVRTAVRRALRTFRRKPESPTPSKDIERRTP
jgi:hypothetical protein